jgi:hypothetical protein
MLIKLQCVSQRSKVVDYPPMFSLLSKASQDILYLFGFFFITKMIKIYVYEQILFFDIDRGLFQNW